MVRACASNPARVLPPDPERPIPRRCGFWDLRVELRDGSTADQGRTSREDPASRSRLPARAPGTHATSGPPHRVSAVGLRQSTHVSCRRGHSDTAQQGTLGSRVAHARGRRPSRPGAPSDLCGHGSTRADVILALRRPARGRRLPCYRAQRAMIDHVCSASPIPWRRRGVRAAVHSCRPVTIPPQAAAQTGPRGTGVRSPGAYAPRLRGRPGLQP